MWKPKQACLQQQCVGVDLPPPGRCARCGDNVVGDGSGCIAMEQVFHVECFTCITCHARLRGQPFYALDKKSYCESCYIVSAECNTRLWFTSLHFSPGSYTYCIIKCIIIIIIIFLLFSLEHTRALLKVFQTHSGPHPTGHGKSLPPSLFHMCGL